MKVFPDRLKGRLESRLDPVYLVAGPELLLVEEACDAIRRKARDEGVAERVVVDADGRFDWNQFGATSENLSLFASQRLIELRLPTGKPGREGGAVLREWVKSDAGDILLIKCQAWEMASEKTAWFRDVEKAGVFVPCWSVKPDRLVQWISQRLRARGLNAGQDVCSFLAERLEGNLLAAAQEIERMALLYGQGAQLNLDQVRSAVADSARFDSFRLVELVLKAQPGAAVRCIRGLIEADTPMPLIIGALTRELQIVEAFQTLTRSMPSGRAMAELKVWKSRQAAIESAANRLQPGRVRRALAELSDLDRMAKSNHRQEFWLHLERLCVNLCDPNRERLSA